jgi:hypothetical protein
MSALRWDCMTYKPVWNGVAACREVSPSDCLKWQGRTGKDDGQRRPYRRPLSTDSRSDDGDIDPSCGSKSSVMTDAVMFFDIGFLVAALLGWLIVPRAHNRSARLGSGGRFHADVRQLEEQLAVALGERAKLRCEIAAMKRDAELTWATERVEGALFRERINDAAYEIARITQALESSGSSIEPMSAYADLEPRTQTLQINGASGQATAPTMHTGALADRIRALRTTASRAAAN